MVQIDRKPSATELITIISAISITSLFKYSSNNTLYLSLMIMTIKPQLLSRCNVKTLNFEFFLKLPL
uniref:Uncharacterized protein n=1 Tax=Onchocerca volvulus TaxID=6282 RepID=A0A8R1XV72_ONCVO